MKLIMTLISENHEYHFLIPFCIFLSCIQYINADLFNYRFRFSLASIHLNWNYFPKSLSRKSLIRRSICGELIPTASLYCVTPSVLQRKLSQDAKFTYICQECGKGYTKWQGQCHACMSWNSIVEKEMRTPMKSGPGTKFSTRVLNPLSLKQIQPSAHSRIFLRGKELNRVFGGGVVPGSIILIGGEPGIGKSTLLLRIASDICNNRKDQEVLYISGEESEDQVKLRCDRLGVSESKLFLIHETNLDAILQLIYANVGFFFLFLLISVQIIMKISCNRKTDTLLL